MLPITAHAINNSRVRKCKSMTIATGHLPNRFLNLMYHFGHSNEEITVCALPALPHWIIAAGHEFTVSSDEATMQISQVYLANLLLKLNLEWLVDNV